METVDPRYRQTELKELKNRIKELESALKDITSKAERYMDDHACNDFTAYIENSKKTNSIRG